MMATEKSSDRSRLFHVRGARREAETLPVMIDIIIGACDSENLSEESDRARQVLPTMQYARSAVSGPTFSDRHPVPQSPAAPASAANNLMRIVPVLDLLEGCVVRGVAGERQRYRPIESPLVDVPTPLNLARAFRDRFGLSTLYVADLDAVLHDRPNLECYRALIEEDFELMIDAGLRDLSGAERVLATGAQFVIAGLETL